MRPALVTFETGPALRAYIARTGLRWPVLIDERRELYRAYGMDRARLWDLIGPGSWLGYARGMLRGHLPRLPHDDVSQRGGDVLIDPAGVVRLHWVGDNPGDRPPLELILERARG